MQQPCGAPRFGTASRVFLALLLAVLTAPLCADDSGDDLLAKASAALKQGDASAITLAAEALKENSLGARENHQIALTWFWAGHFEDSARYMRRALAGDPNVLLNQPVLADSMPADDATQRLNQLAREIDDNADLCFLTGVLLLNGDRPRALAFLVRAAELAGTDGQAEALIRGRDEKDRSELRALASLKDGDYADAERSFTFAALDSPTVAEHYAGLTVSLACSGQLDVARRIAKSMYARYHHERLFEWLHGLEVARADLLAPARELDVKDAPSGDCRLAMLLYMTARHWDSAREAGVRGLLKDDMDTFIHDARIWMDERGHYGNAPEDPAASEPEDTPEPPRSTPPDGAGPDDARRFIREGDYTRARDVLDELTHEEAAPEVFYLLFIALAGLEEFEQAAIALQAWFLKAGDSQRMRLNALRELFGKEDIFEAWRGAIVAHRDAEPNAFAPRLLNAHVEITRGRYGAARDELVVADIASPGNPMVLALNRLLRREEYARDTTPEGIVDDPSATALFGRGDRLFRDGKYADARSAYLQAQEKDPQLRHVSAALFRCHFALGDYDNAYTQLQRMLEEQDVAEGRAGAFQLMLKDGYVDTAGYESHVEALKAECENRPLSWKPWLLYGVVLMHEKNYGAALKAMQTWHDNVTEERHPAHLKLYELAKQRAS